MGAAAGEAGGTGLRIAADQLHLVSSDETGPAAVKGVCQPADGNGRALPICTSSHKKHMSGMPATC